jgi:hypothetical protein
MHWNLIYDIIKRVIRLYNAIDTFIQRIRSEWEEALGEARSPFKKVEDKPFILNNMLMPKD